MGTSRQLSNEALELVASRFRVLAEPLRLRLLQCLGRKECSVTELARVLETTQPNVSKHLKLLHAAGFVSRRQEKNAAFYALADPLVFQLCELVCDRLHQRLTAQADAVSPRGERRPRKSR